MAKDWAIDFYNSKAWEDCRLAFMRSKFFICERCGGAATIAHHKTYLTPANINDPNVTLSSDNLEALCQDCHNREHQSKHSATRDDVMFDENGDLIPARGTPLFKKLGAPKDTEWPTSKNLGTIARMRGVEFFMGYR